LIGHDRCGRYRTAQIIQLRARLHKRKSSRLCWDLAHIKTKSTRAQIEFIFAQAAPNVHHQQQKLAAQTQFLGAVLPGQEKKLMAIEETLPCNITRLDSRSQKKLIPSNKTVPYQMRQKLFRSHRAVSHQVE
jgi:hypothetical protein